MSSPVSASALGSTLVGVTAAVLRPAAPIPVPAGYADDPDRRGPGGAGATGGRRDGSARGAAAPAADLGPREGDDDDEDVGGEDRREDPDECALRQFHGPR